MRIPAILCALSVLLAAPVAAADRDPASLPSIGAVAPAIGLYPFESKATTDDLREKVELDDYCGMRPAHPSSLVLVVFSSAISIGEDLQLLATMQRKFGRDGFTPFVLSTADDSAPIKALVAKSRYSFPIVDDRFHVVAQRYGARAPFSFLLDAQCQILGLSDKALNADAERLTATIDTLLSGKPSEIEGYE